MMLIMLLLAGCAAQPLHLVNAMGDDEQCLPQSRQGVMGRILPQHVSEACVQSLTQMGFVSRDVAGMVNLGVAMSGRDVVVTTIPESALAQQPDIAPGDVVLAVDNQKPESVQAANALMFGRRGSEVALLLGRGELRFPLKLTRLPLAQAGLVEGVPQVSAVKTEVRQVEPVAEVSKEASAAVLAAGGVVTGAEIPAAEAVPKPAAEGFFAAMKHKVASYFTKSKQPAAVKLDQSAEETPAAAGKAEAADGTDLAADGVSIEPELPEPDPLKPLIMAGDQVCHLRGRFIDVATAEEVRGQRLLINIKHMQLVNPPYTEFHHFSSERQWGALADWHPCLGEAPLFLTPSAP
ncbi:MAG: hypothetical protein R8J84_07380 [Mariprofundales bacterium]